MVTTLDVNEIEAPLRPTQLTQTDPTLELDPSVRLLNVASGIQDSSITVVQNPIVGNIGEIL